MSVPEDRPTRNPLLRVGGARARARSDGGRGYRLAGPQPVPGKLFWSVTVYDARTRSQVQTEQARAVLSSLFDFADTADVDSVDLYFGPEAPVGREHRWIQTIPGPGWFVYFRVYGSEEPACDGTCSTCRILALPSRLLRRGNPAPVRSSLGEHPDAGRRPVTMLTSTGFPLHDCPDFRSW